MKKLLCMLLATITLAGCSSKIAEYSVLSNRNIDVTHSSKFSRGIQVIGTSGGTLITIFPLGKPDVSSALKEAIDKDRCVVGLTDVTITHNTLWLVYLGFQNVKVEGRQLLDTALAGCEHRR